MSDSWTDTTLGSVVTLQRGFDITRSEQRAGSVPVVSSGGISGYNDVAMVPGPGVVMGRKGTLGKVFYLPGPYWPHDTTLWVKDFKGNDARFTYYFLTQLDFSAFDVGSANPTLNRNHVHPLRIRWPYDVREQHAIAEVLEALDDKIAANSTQSTSAEKLAGVVYRLAAKGAPRQPMSAVVTPILGGTPDRASSEYWGGTQPWVSARDVTGAPHAVVLKTEEMITDLAAGATKARPIRRGSVIMTARGTVGAVARLGVEAAFNQSCYGFLPDRLPPSVLYFSVLHARDEAKAFSHGSVFNTITMNTFDHLSIPRFSSQAASALESRIAPLLAVVESACRESILLADLRDALLPQLMSGRLRVRDAEKQVGEVV